MPKSPRFARRVAAAASSTLVLAVVLAAGAVVPAALSAPGGSRVTICHRTHAVTNPYRLITVNANAADGVGSSDHTGHNLAYESGGVVYPIFDPSVSYPPNEKHWGDIIPPVRNSAGLNWTVPGAQEMYSGTGDAFGLCGRLSAKQFYDLEVAAGVDPLAVLADLDDQASLEDAALKNELGISSFSELDPAAMPAGFDSVAPAPLGVRPPAGYGPEAGMQKIAVFVWFDTNRNGAFDNGELPAPGVVVTLGAVVDVASAGFGPASDLVIASGEHTTDADGLVMVNSIAAGQWDAAATAPADTEVTYDSEGIVDDGEAQVDVPADSAGFAWVGLVSVDPAASDGSGSPALADSGLFDSATHVLMATAAILLAIGVWLRSRPAATRRARIAR